MPRNFYPYLGEYYYGIAEVLIEKDCHVTIDKAFSREIFKLFPKERDGVIVHADADLKYYPDCCWPETFPVVRFNILRGLETDCVDPDDPRGVQELVGRLLDLGYRHFIYVEPAQQSIHPHASFQIRRSGISNIVKKAACDIELTAENSHLSCSWLWSSSRC